MRRTAPGIPDRDRFVPIPEASATDWEYAVQRHEARRAGTHYDLRLAPDRHAHSWAVRRWPRPGETVLAVQQPTHARGYMDWEGEIPAGRYGAGPVSLHDRGRVRILQASPDKIVFHRYRGKQAEEYALIRTGQRHWLLRNVTPSGTTPSFPQWKPPYGVLEWAPKELARRPGVMTPKISGAHGLLVLRSGEYPRLFSVRRPVRGGALEWTHKLPELRKQRVPKGVNAVLRVEVYLADRRGRPLPEERTAGVLNAGIEKALSMQAGTGGLQLAAFAVHEGPTAAGDYEEQLSWINGLSRQLPFLRTPETARTLEEKARLLESIEEKRHPMTSEGVVLHDGGFWKSKPVEEADVYPAKVLPGRGKHRGAAGGFTYALEPEGPEVGKVGGGFSDELRRELWKQRSRIRGRVAVLRYGKQMPSGAYYAPRFERWHTEKDPGGWPEETETGGARQTAV